MNNTIDKFEVIDRTTFVQFLEKLRQDFLDNPHTWENKTLPDFLEALNSYGEDIQGHYDNMNIDINADQANWKVFADIFKGARIYE